MVRYVGTLVEAATKFIEANPGCTVKQVAQGIATTEGSAAVIICRIRERVWFASKTILTYQKPDGLRFKKEEH